MAKLREFIDLQHFRSYEFAALVHAVARDQWAFIDDLLQGLFLEDNVLVFVEPWQRKSALHIFTEFIADVVFQGDCDGANLVAIGTGAAQQLVLPVDSALIRHGLAVQEDAFVPDGKDSRANQYFEYFQNLRLGAPYERPLEEVADEVFYLMFSDRETLQGLNSLIATHLSSVEYDSLEEYDDDGSLVALFDGPGRLRRRQPPQWAKRAVFMREQGRCACCGSDLSGVLTTLNKKHFDHVVPLASGGLNDITNLQLLCDECNLSKGKRAVPTSVRHPRWYPR